MRFSIFPMPVDPFTYKISIAQVGGRAAQRARLGRVEGDRCG